MMFDLRVVLVASDGSRATHTLSVGELEDSPPQLRRSTADSHLSPPRCRELDLNVLSRALSSAVRYIEQHTGTPANETVEKGHF